MVTAIYCGWRSRLTIAAENFREMVGLYTHNDGADSTISIAFQWLSLQLKSTNYKQMPKEVQLFSSTSYSSFPIWKEPPNFKMSSTGCPSPPSTKYLEFWEGGASLLYYINYNNGRGSITF